MKEKMRNGGMFSWLKTGDRKSKETKQPEVFASVTDGLRKLYKYTVLPFEEYYQFHKFHSPPLDDADFESKPSILLVGQYSTGKTTFIRYLLEQDFPGMRIGPEPTTDRFIVVSHGEEESIIPGNALVVDGKKPFRALAKFGNAFLNRFQCSTLDNKVLESLTVIDTPGILSGEKQRTDRGYDFTAVIEWLAEKVDRIILLFDAHKLDISDEFRTIIESMKGYDDKIRIVLNKSDLVDHQELMRVYGALMWSLGKVLNTPEVARVYIGSFWDKPLHNDINRPLFELEEQDLFRDIQSLPRNAAIRKLNDLIKRTRLAKVHALILCHLKEEMPQLFGKTVRQRELIQHLTDTFTHIQRKYQISPGDFPNVLRMREQLRHHDFSNFRPYKAKKFLALEKMLADDVSWLMSMIPKDEHVCKQIPVVKGGAFNGDVITPFGVGAGRGADKGRGEHEWIVGKNREKYEQIFQSLSPVDGKVSGSAAKQEMMKSKLPNVTLSRIWRLSDVDQDGMLDLDEFGLALHLIDVKLSGNDVPAELPDHLIPPSKMIPVINGS